MSNARSATMRIAIAVGAFTAFAGTAVVLAAGLEAPADVGEPAERIEPVAGELAVVYDVGDIDRESVEAADRVATRIGASAAVGRTGSLGMRAITRNGTTVHAPPSGYLVPMVYQALPRGPVGRVMGLDVAAVLASDAVVMNEVTATSTGAAVGDVIVMQAADGSALPLRITGISPPEQIGSAELVFTTAVADRLGATADTRAVIYGFDDQDAFDEAVEQEGVEDRRDTKVVRSWDAPNPDSTLSTLETKELLGEPWYTFTSSTTIAMHPTWTATNLRPARELLNDVVRVRARCHVEIVDDLSAALADVAAAGLANEIEVANANTYGGCYGGARYSRTSGQIGFLSRHSYGMALDTNTVSNCQGCIPKMHCEVVRIFRRNGFAWGGNFRRPDGMHFEWVGEPRDQIDYPSEYCPNIVTGGPAPGTNAPAAALGTDVLLAGEAERVGSAHDHPHGP